MWFTKADSATPFDWSEVVALPVGGEQVPGSQVLHFKSTDKPYANDADATAFVAKHLATAQALHSDTEVLRYASDAVTVDGAFIEMGVCTGKTINYVAALNPHRAIHGFDSFKGLPEDWVRKDKIFTKGTFGFKRTMLPPVLHNVQLHVGLFSETLAAFAKNLSDPVAFLHIDCDLYSSTAQTFNILGPHIADGTVVVFDELYNYPGFEEHEYKAFTEFLAQSGYAAEYLAYNTNHEQVAVRIITK